MLFWKSTWKTDFDFVLLSLYLLVISKKYETYPWFVWGKNTLEVEYPYASQSLLSELGSNP
jgi:hypothetical protein